MARRKPARRPKRSRQVARRTPRRTGAVKRARRASGRRKTRTAATVRRKTTKPSGQATKSKSRTTRPISKSKVTRPKVRSTRRPAVVPPAAEAAGSRRTPHAPPKLDRERRRLADIEGPTPPSNRTEADDRAAAAARSGHEELKASLARHTETSPTLTAGDLDARWEDAYAVGDEAPGGDNPTPDQDRVDDIGKALGVVYEDAEELRASDKVAERDRHRWELDPASSDDWPHDGTEK
jgi:hypothetical protein